MDAPGSVVEARGDIEEPQNDTGKGLKRIAASLCDVVQLFPGVVGNLPVTGGPLPGIGERLRMFGEGFPGIGERLRMFGGGFPGVGERLYDTGGASSC